jgi:uncharacterized protein (DUF2267 family)
MAQQGALLSTAWTVLQALRDWLPVNEAADLAAQLPNLLRGVFYEHWRPGATPVKHRAKADFLARIDHAFVGEPILSAEAAACIAFQFLSTKIAAGEIQMFGTPCRRTCVRCGRYRRPPREVRRLQGHVKTKS